MQRPTVTVVICTRNRCASLAQTLASIADDSSNTQSEVLVVDNASTDQTDVILVQAAETSPRPFRTITTPVRGLAQARNDALKHVRTDLCLFTDDDVSVEPGWIDTMANAFADPGVGAVGGRVIPRFRGEDRPSWMADEQFFRRVTLWDEGTEPFRMWRGRYPVGANMAFRMATLPRSPFDPRFGHTGQAALGYEEWELFDRVIDMFAVVYEPRAVVYHWIDASRLSFSAVRSKMFQSGVGTARYHNAGKQLPSYPRRLVRAARVARAAVAARRRTARDGIDASTAVDEMRALQDAGAQMETLLSRWPRISEWVSTKV